MTSLLPPIAEEVELPLRWSQRCWRYRLQFQAMASAWMVSVAGGMKLAWSVYETPSGKFLSNSRTHLLMLAWFVGSALGAVVAATFVQRVTKNVAYCTAGALLLFGGILFITLPTHFVALLCSCLCEGCAFGLSQVQALTSGAEVSQKQIRGLLISSERIALWLGICLQLVLAGLWYAALPAAHGHNWHGDQLHGIVVACLGLLTIMFALLHHYESPLLLQRQQRDYAATHTMQKLLQVPYPTQQAVAEMRDDIKQLLAHDSGRPACQVFWQSNALPLLKVLCLRCLASISLSLPFNRAYLTTSWYGFGCDTNCLYALALSGLLGSLFGALTIDRRGRRRTSVVCLLLSGIFVFVVGGIFRHLQLSQQALRSLDFEMADCLLLSYQFVTCTGIALASTVYTAEAFTPTQKAPCIATVLVSEQLLQIALTVIGFSVNIDNSVFFFVMGTLCLLMGLFVFTCMPETKGLSLSACLVKFGKCPRCDRI